MTDDDDILAAEFALGLLDEREGEAVRLRARTDAVLSLRIAWWRDQLAPLAGEAATSPPPTLWSRIERGLPDNDNTRAARPWKWATGAMGAIAAALLAVIALRPDAAPESVAPRATTAVAPLVASLSGNDGMAVTITYDRAMGRMLVTPVALDPGKGDAELWVIPVGETVPVSMGVIDAKAAGSHMLDVGHAALLAPGATFAISQEAKGGSPTGHAQGPIVASGKIILV